MATLSTDTIVDLWLRGLAADGEPFYADGRRLSAIGYRLSGSRRRGDLAEWLPAGRRRSRPLLLVTGDAWPSDGMMQTNLQWLVRLAVQRRVAELGADMALIPFSALESAGVIRSTIRPLEIRPDRETITYEPIELDLDDMATAPIRRAYEEWHEVGTAHIWPLSDGRIVERKVASRRRGYGHGSEWTEVAEPEPTAPRAYRSRRTTWGDDIERNETGTWQIVHRRHWLGDSVFTADVETTARRRRSWTVADVISAARDAIGAESADRYSALNTYRTSDGYSRTGASLALHRRLESDSVAPASGRLAAVDIGAPIVETHRVRRRRRFVSSFDINEPRALYYLATLPTASRAVTVEMAEQDLAPASVHAAIARGRDVRRQGDIFLVESDLDDTAVYATARTRARLTQWTRQATPRLGEVGAYRPISRRRWRLIRSEWRAEWRTKTAEVLAGSGPRSAHGARRTAHKDRLQLETQLARYRATARRAVLTGDRHDARRYRELAAGATAELERLRLTNGRLKARDSYRGHGTAAIDRRNYASSAAYARHSGRPQTSRELIRETLAVYATAHSATEVAIIDGRPYVKGIVRHVPSLIGDTWRDPEHVQIKLPAGRWYLAIRNTVPRLGDGA